VSDVLLDRLDAVRRRVRQTRLIAGTVQTLLALIGLAVAWFLLDWLMVSRLFDPGSLADKITRGLLVATVLFLCWEVFRRTILRELAVTRTDDQMAMRVELRHPGLKGRLISTVQLTRQLGSSDGLISDEMIEALVEETEHYVDSVDFAAIIDWKLLRRIVIVGAVVFLAFGGLAWWRRDYAKAMMGRLTLTGSSYPTATHIIATSKPATIAKGEPYTITVDIDPAGYIPDHATAVVQLKSGRNDQMTLARDDKAPKGTVRFTGTISQALDDFSFRAEAYDTHTVDWVPVTVVVRPAVKSLAVACAFPDYLGMPAATTPVGDLRVPAGTVVKLNLQFTKAVATATLLRREVHTDLPEAAITLDATRTAGSASFTVTANGDYRILLKDPQGFEGQAAAYTITSVPDHAPTVTVTFPTTDKDVSKYARWPLRFNARDDHGLAQAWLKYQIWSPDPSDSATAPAADAAAVDPAHPAAGGDAAAAVVSEPPVKEIPLDGLAKPGETAVSHEVMFDLAQLHVVEDQRVSWWIEVADNCTPNANHGQSVKYAFTVVDLATLNDELDRQRAELLQQVKVIRDKQDDVHSSVESLRHHLDTGNK
jgi:hypothetical protein